MSILLTLFLFTSVVFADGDRDFCLPTQKQAVYFQRILEQKAQHLWIRLFWTEKRSNKKPRISHSKNCDNCLVVDSDAYIKGALKEQFDELVKEKKIDKLLEERPVKNLKLDVTVADLYPDEKIHEKVFFNKLYKAFLRFPDQMQNVFYDKNNVPVYVSAKMINEGVIGYTFLYKDQKHLVINEINEPILCMFPYTDEFKEKYPDIDYFRGHFFMKEDDRTLPVKDFRILSIVRDFYWPQENIPEL